MPFCFNASCQFRQINFRFLVFVLRPLLDCLLFCQPLISDGNIVADLRLLDLYLLFHYRNFGLKEGLSVHDNQYTLVHTNIQTYVHSI